MISFTPLTALPAAPSRFATPSDFEAQWDAYLTAQNALVTEQNALIAAMNAQLVDATFGTTTIYTLTATQASSVTSMADVPGMVAALEASATYKFDAYISFKSAATTTGAAIGYNAPAGSNPMLQIDVPSSTNGQISSRIFPNASAVLSGSVVGTGVTSTSDVQTAKIVGIIKTTTAGNFSIQFASEVPSSAVTLQIGSTMTMTRIA